MRKSIADTIAPVVTLTSPTSGLTLGNNSISVTGSVNDSAATAYLIVNGGSPTVLSLDGEGNFSQGVSLNTGSNTLLVKATDGVGNTGTSGTITVVVNPNKPSVFIIQPATGLKTNNPTLTVQGAVSGNVSSVNLILNGVSQSVTVVSGSFSANITLTEGKNMIIANTYTGGHEGNRDYLGASGLRRLILDTTGPVISIATPLSGSTVSTPGCTVSGSIDDPRVSTANLILNGVSQAIPVSSGNFSQSVTLAFGNNTISVTAIDGVGNTGLSSALMEYDNAKPEVTITSPSNGLVTGTAGQAITGTISDQTITSATLYLNGSPQSISVSSGSFSQSVTLSSGANTLEVRASDGATPPNTGTSGVITITLDNTSPTLTIGLSDPTDSITITVISDEILASAPTVTVNPTIVMEATGVNEWTGTYGNSGSPIVSGNYTVTVTGSDKAGNTRVKTATFCKGTVTVSANGTATIGTDTTTLEIDTTSDITDASISVTQHTESPSGNAGNPSGAGSSAGVYLEIVASPELRDNLEGIYVRVDYDPADLPDNTDESTLKLYLWDIATGSWEVVSSSGVNTIEHYIYGTLTHLSKYGGFGATVSTPTTPPPPSGGGGGGGGGGRTRVKLSGITATTDLELDRYGRAQDDCQLTSLDGNTRLDISRKTKLLNPEGEPLESISVIEISKPHSSPSQTAIIYSYDFGPDGTQFDPAITMTFSYDSASATSLTAENETYIAYWDGSQWSALESTVDTEAKTVSANVSHFTQFAVIGKLPPPPPPAPASMPSPARFTVFDLSVTPAEVEPPGRITISAVVENTGGSRGSYTVILKINGIEDDQKEVTLGAYQSETVTFTLVKDKAGSYTVDIGSQTEQFTVLDMPLKPSPEPEETQTTASVPVPSTTNWWLIGGIIAGSIIIVGLLGSLLVKRKRSA